MTILHRKEFSRSTHWACTTQGSNPIGVCFRSLSGSNPKSQKCSILICWITEGVYTALEDEPCCVIRSHSASVPLCLWNRGFLEWTKSWMGVQSWEETGGVTRLFFPASWASWEWQPVTTVLFALALAVAELRLSSPPFCGLGTRQAPEGAWKSPNLSTLSMITLSF